MFEYFLSKFYIAWVELSNKPVQWFVELACYLMAGFAIGFLVKQYGKLFFILTFCLLAFLACLHYFDAISIQLDLISIFQSNINATNGQLLIDWMREHVVQSICSLSAFVIAWKFM